MVGRGGSDPERFADLGHTFSATRSRTWLVTTSVSTREPGPHHRNRVRVPLIDSEPVLVFDVGGTSLRAAVYDPSTSSLIASTRRPTPGFRNLPGAEVPTLQTALYDGMHHLGVELFPAGVPGRVVVGFAGPLDPAGRVLAAPGIWGSPGGSDPVDLASVLEQRWPASRVWVLNDVTAAGYRFLDRPNADLCVITVSTGIGHKVFIGGSPSVGPAGRGGELGHLRVDFSEGAPLCDCGSSGHLGAVSSGNAAALQVRRLAAEDGSAFKASRVAELAEGHVEAVNNAMLAEAFVVGDRWAQQVVRRMALPLGRVIAAVHLAVGVERFVIIGGFALALGEGFREMLWPLAAAAGWDVGADWSRMIELDRDPDAGLVGAGRYAVEYLGRARPPGRNR
jgi:predicted NBD/HSP70 family sugar kinase